MEAKIPYKNTTGKPVYCHHVEDQPGKKGMFMHIVGRKSAWKGFPKDGMVSTMDITKDIISTPLMYVPKNALKILFGLLGVFALLNKKLFGKFASWTAKTLIDSLWYPIEKYKLNPLKYTRSVREIYRLFSILADREEQESMKDKWKRLRDIVCLILEYDNSYRFRLQDILAEMRMEEIAFDGEDRDWIVRRSPWEYRYESVVDYTDWDKEMEKLLEKLPEELKPLAKEAIKYQEEGAFVKDIITKFPVALIGSENLKKYGYDSLEDFLNKIRNIKYKKVEQELLKKEEELMELKAYYEEKLKRLNDQFGKEKDDLIDEISSLMKRFWARAANMQAEYRESQALLNAPDKNPLLPEQPQPVAEPVKAEAVE